MKHLLVLLDFTETAQQAIDQALAVAKLHKPLVTLCHIAKEDSSYSEAGTLEQIKPYKDLLEGSGIETGVFLSKGNLFTEAKKVVEQLRPDLIVAGTHGVKGLYLSLMGSAIHKLVKEVPCSTLVVTKESKIVHGGYKKILMTAAPHPNYHIKVDQVSSLIAKEGEVVLFVVKMPVPDKDSMRNIEAAKEIFETRGIKWRLHEVEPKPHSVGFAAQTLEAVRAEGVDLIAIMSQISKRNSHFGKLDKETILLNEDGLQVLCANEEMTAEAC